MGLSRPLFVYFRPFLITISIIQIEKSIYGVLEIQTRGCMMVKTDNTMELWWLPIKYNVYRAKLSAESCIKFVERCHPAAAATAFCVLC